MDRLPEAEWPLEPIDLVPVSEWIYGLWAIRYMDQENGSTLLCLEMVTTEPNIEELGERAPSNCEWIEWYLIEDNVAPPPICGNWRGFPLREDPWSTAELHYPGRV
jgi:hypothetical protein